MFKSSFFAIAFALFTLNTVASEAPAATGLATWDKIYQVFSHPRCANCHVPADGKPRWSGPSYGQTRVHGMNVQAGFSRIGAENGALCSTCHAQTNSDEPHGPPGAPIWMLPPISMTWWNKSSAEICQQIQDPKQNGGRDLTQVAHHIEHDALVQWGWEPGPGREAAPYSAKQVAEFITQWASLGAPCPTE